MYTIGSPSVFTYSNKNPLLFDENLTWTIDCEYYCRMFQLYGEPVYLKDINVTIGLHDGQVSNLLSDERKTFETDYLIQKYGQRI